MSEVSTTIASIHLAEAIIGSSESAEELIPRWEAARAQDKIFTFTAVSGHTIGINPSIIHGISQETPEGRDRTFKTNIAIEMEERERTDRLMPLGMRKQRTATGPLGLH